MRRANYWEMTGCEMEGSPPQGAHHAGSMVRRQCLKVRPLAADASRPSVRSVCVALLSTWTARHDHAPMRTCIHTHTHIYIYVCIYVLMRVYIYIYMYKYRCSPRFAFMRLKWQHSVATVSPTQSMRWRPLILDQCGQGGKRMSRQFS